MGRNKTTKTAAPTAQATTSTGEAPKADKRNGTILAALVAFVAIAIGGVILSTSENVESNEQLKSAFDEFYAANVQPLVGDADAPSLQYDCLHNFLLTFMLRRSWTMRCPPSTAQTTPSRRRRAWGTNCGSRARVRNIQWS